MQATIVPGRSENYLLVDDITIVLHEVPTQNWGIRGGQPASEVDLGFEVKV